MHWLPTRLAASLTSFGFLTAAVLIETLSAPAWSMRRTSSTTEIPPPTVSGMKTCSAVRDSTSRISLRFSWDAVMSRKTSSSAPWAS